MNIQHLRHSLKVKWLLYYRQNRPWLVQLRIWETYDGQRRPSSSFILATVSILEPQLTQMFPLIVDLSNNPDQIVAALGLNFDPDVELKSMMEPLPVVETNGHGNGLAEAIPVSETNGHGNGLAEAIPASETNGHGNGLAEAIPVSETNGHGNGLSMQIPASVADEVSASSSTQASNLPSLVDEACSGKGSPNAGMVLSILALIGSLAVVFIGFTG